MSSYIGNTKVVNCPRCRDKVMLFLDDEGSKTRGPTECSCEAYVTLEDDKVRANIHGRYLEYITKNESDEPED